MARVDRVIITLHFYFVGDRFSGEPRILDGQPGVGWFSGVEMMALNLAPANQRAKAVLVEAIRREG